LISPSVLPALKLKGSKNPKGAVCPARPSADIDTLANEGRAMTAGRNATAEAARDAMRTAWNIVRSEFGRSKVDELIVIVATD
jgi:hypothetical protein